MTNNVNKENPHLIKNKFYNLLVVCQKCHDMIDRNDIKVNGWVMTSKGIDLDYSINKNKNDSKNLKYNKDTITKVYDVKNKCKTVKEARLYIKENFDVKISTSTISKIWNNEYI